MVFTYGIHMTVQASPIAVVKTGWELSQGRASPPKNWRRRSIARRRTEWCQNHSWLLDFCWCSGKYKYIYNLIYNVRVEICVNNWKYHGDTLDLDDRRPLPSKPPTASSTRATAATAFATYKNKAGQGCSTKLPSDSCHHLQISTVCVKIWTESIDINCTKIPGFSHNTL